MYAVAVNTGLGLQSPPSPTNTFFVDITPPAAPVVVLGHDLWTERFNGDPGVIGRTLRVNGQSSEVIGVMPKGFSFPSAVDLWLANRQDPARVSRHDAVPVQVFGRLREDASPDVAQQELAPAAAAIKAELGKRGYATYVTSEGAGARFKVRVGPIASRAEAERVAERLKTEHRLPTWILASGK